MTGKDMKIRAATNHEWDVMTAADDSATYSQTRAWYEIWGKYEDLHMDTRIIEFSSGKRVLFPLAYSVHLCGLLKYYKSSPAGIGGFVTPDQLTIREKAALYELLKGFPAITLIGNPYSEVFDQFHGWNRRDTTHVIDLAPGFDSIFRKWSKGHVSAAKKGKRMGVTVDIARDRESWLQYYQCYKDSLRRWGASASIRYAWKLFDLMSQSPSDGIRLWIARAEGSIVGGCLCFYYNRHIFYWHGAALEKYFPLKPMHLLQYHIMQDACDRKYRWYDMGTSGGHEGPDHFKRGFSPAQRQLSIVQHFPLMVNVARTIRQKMRRKAFQ